jgi:hypothetical protein
MESRNGSSFALSDDLCDIITVFRSLKTEHLGFISMVFRLQAQSADLGAASLG